MPLPILTFHALEDVASAISFRPSMFRQAIARLHQRGFRTLDLGKTVGHVLRGTTFPARSVVITFDDGYQSVYTEAFPVLARYGMSATLFLTTGERPPASPRQRLPELLGRKMLSWSEVREMQRAGFAVGAHSLTHPDLTRLSEPEIERQMSDSRTLIEDALGMPVPCFAYPFGRHDRRSRHLARRHFLCACTDQLGLAGGESDPSTLKRVDTNCLRSPHWFDQLESPLFPWYLRARRAARRLRGDLGVIMSDLGVILSEAKELHARPGRSFAIAQGDIAIAEEDSAIPRDDIAVARGDSAIARGDFAIARGDSRGNVRHGAPMQR